MSNEGLTAGDVRFLEGLAELLLGAGRDRAADAIYAAIEARERRSVVASTGNVVTVRFPARD